MCCTYIGFCLFGLTSLLTNVDISQWCPFVAACFHIATVPVFCSAASLECHAAGTRHGIPLHHMMQTHGRPGVMLSVDMNTDSDATTSLIVLVSRVTEIRNKPQTIEPASHCLTNRGLDEKLEVKIGQWDNF